MPNYRRSNIKPTRYHFAICMSCRWTVRAGSIMNTQWKTKYSFFVFLLFVLFCFVFQSSPSSFGSTWTLMEKQQCICVFMSDRPALITCKHVFCFCHVIILLPPGYIYQSVLLGIMNIEFVNRSTLWLQLSFTLLWRIIQLLWIQLLILL